MQLLRNLKYSFHLIGIKDDKPSTLRVLLFPFYKPDIPCIHVIDDNLKVWAPHPFEPDSWHQ